MHCSLKYSYICKKTPGQGEISTPLPTPAPGNCPEGYEPFLDKCFKFSDDEQSWNHSRYKCEEQTTDDKKHTLVSIHNKQENGKTPQPQPPPPPPPPPPRMPRRCCYHRHRFLTPCLTHTWCTYRLPLHGCTYC